MGSHLTDREIGMSENEIKPVAWDMPCGGCDCGIYDAAAIAAFNGDIPRCKSFERQCVGATHAALAEMGRLTAALEASHKEAQFLRSHRPIARRLTEVTAERDAAVAVRGRYLCDGPEGHFFCDDLKLARGLVNAYDKDDDWTITDMMNPHGAGK